MQVHKKNHVQKKPLLATLSFPFNDVFWYGSMATLKALIFDVDGTIADTERDGHLAAFNLAFKEEGLDWDWSPELYGKLLAVTGGKERMRYYLDEFRKEQPDVEDLDAYIAHLHARKTHYYVSLLNEGGIPLRPGIERLFAEAREQGIRLAISTTTTVDNVTALLKNTLGSHAADWFEVIAAGDVVPKKKPAPDIYQYALEKLNLPAENCVAFEDSENGIKSAAGAGLHSIIAINDYTKDHQFDGALIVVDHMGEPDMPFNVIEGDAHNKKYIDLELVKTLHAEQG